MFIPQYLPYKNTITYPSVSLEWIRYYLDVYNRAFIYSTPNEVELFEAMYTDIPFWLLPNDHACPGCRKYFVSLSLQ